MDDFDAVLKEIRYRMNQICDDIAMMAMDIENYRRHQGKIQALAELEGWMLDLKKAQEELES